MGCEAFHNACSGEKRMLNVRCRALAVILLAGGLLVSPLSRAEPCPNEWNAFVQLTPPTQHAQVQSWSDDRRYSYGTQSFLSHTGILGLGLGHHSQWANDPVALRKAAEVLFTSSAGAMTIIGAEYRYGACRARARADELERRSGSRANPAPAPSPKAAPRAAAPAEKLPPARPAKMAPWSPEAMSTNFDTEPPAKLNPRFAAERADILASCQGPVQQYGSKFRLNSVEANMTVEVGTLHDSTMQVDPAVIKAHLAKFDGMIASGALTAEAAAMGRCALQRRIAQLEGSPLATGAVDGTLNPLSIGNPGTQWKQQGKDARIIASNGKSAMDCVKLVEVSNIDAKMTGVGGRVLVNNCAGPVEITWCYAPGDCYTTGNSWTLGLGRSWPVSGEKPIRWAACHGANTASFVKGSHGLRYYCSAPAKK